MILTFGKHKGKEVSECPSSYLAWLIDPKINDKYYPVHPEIMKEAKDLYEKRRFEEHYIEWRLAGRVGDKTEYIIERLGDLSGITMHVTLEKALEYLEIEFPKYTQEEIADWKKGNEDWEVNLYRKTPDPEDDRILIWEVLASGHKKVVWHFSGWHWDAEEFPHLDQGKLPSDDKCLYYLAMEDY